MRPRAMFLLPAFLFFSSAHASSCDSFETCKPLAEIGDADAQYMMAVLIDNEILFKTVSEEVESEHNLAAFKWYQKAAEQGHVDAQIAVGESYLVGRGVEKSETEAKKWFIRAAGSGTAMAQDRLGNFYEWTEFDTAEAIYWYKKSAAQDWEEASSSLVQIGAIYGLDQDRQPESYAWYRAAIERALLNGSDTLKTIYFDENEELFRSLSPELQAKAEGLYRDIYAEYVSPFVR